MSHTTPTHCRGCTQHPGVRTVVPTKVQSMLSYASLTTISSAFDQPWEHLVAFLDTSFNRSGSAEASPSLLLRADRHFQPAACLYSCVTTKLNHSRRLKDSGRFVKSDRPIRSGRTARSRALTIPKSLAAKYDNKLTFDKVSDVYRSGTEHDEDQPPHLKVLDFDVCVRRCTQEYGNPCQYFCPAAVYEIEEANGGRKPKINFSNCVHCKTCDIMDPYQIIDWVTPEGGGGPNYINL
jgi:ferredoxin-like protein FixX